MSTLANITSLNLSLQTGAAALAVKAVKSVAKPARTVYVFGTADNVAPNFTTVSGALTYANSLTPIVTEPVVIRLFTKADGTPYDLAGLSSWTTYANQYIYFVSDFVRLNETTTLPTTLPSGQQVWYIDPNGVETLWVGREDGSAWPAVGYKEYVALLTQTGTNAPVATVLSNTLGSGTWSRADAGSYVLTFSSSVFTLGKTVPEAIQILSGQFVESMTTISQSRSGATTYGIESNSADISADNSTPTDGLLTNYAFSIRVYP
jgi:hypothetical protein